MSSVIVASPVNSIAFDGFSIPDFDDNGAAIAGGLNHGELYRTPDQKINVVKKSNIILDFGDRLSLLWRAFW